MNENWLSYYLDESVRRDLCTTIYCTTCGSREFRLGILRTLAETKGIEPQTEYNRENIVEIAMALADVQPDVSRSSKFEDAVRCLLFDLWSPIPILNAELKSILEGTWAGELLKRMEDHENERADARRAQEEFEAPVNAQKRRDERTRLNAEKHQERLEKKKERDRLWRIEQTNTENPQ